MFRVLGSFDRTFAFLRKMLNNEAYAALESYAQEGVDALKSFTPVDTGITADSWTYEIVDESNLQIIWSNTHVNDGVNIAIILQFGHGTGTGGYVAGRDYINPALQPVFDKIAENVWRAVTNA